ncbi:TRAP transporter large permease subunit [Marinobacter sp. 71-i]|uniref:TRAP transporter large permease subunit n=2 Tax=Marinobacter iranensis TaxID=2962607 RepID=A0ABT5Y7B8_9GAMM|nr:TRAP transporter large permease subunit [Marinobacter iranensis]
MGESKMPHSYLDAVPHESETLEKREPTDSPHPISRSIDGLCSLAGIISAAGLLIMTGIICFEVISRYFFNSPTSWSIEIATYIFVAIAFLGLSVAQRSGSHVQVEILVSRLDGPRRTQVELSACWISLFFVGVAAWQMAKFNYREYVNGTRDWGLLATPQWIPELAVSLGLILFAVSILGEIFRLRPPRSMFEQWIVPLISLVLVAGLLLIGNERIELFESGLTLGLVSIFVALFACAWAWSGLRIASVFALSYLALGLLYYALGDTSKLSVGLLLVGSLLLLLLAGVRVGLAMGVVGLLGLLLLFSSPNLAMLADRSWTSINTFTLTAIPMFVLMGHFLIRSGVTSDLFDTMTCWFGRMPGGLANASVGASAVFAAVSGSSLATAATLGQVAAPEMMRRGYSARLTYGVVAAGATLGILIPPSIAMIIYGNVVGVSITQLFLAGMVPGAILIGLFITTVLVWSVFVPGAAPKEESRRLGEKVASLGKLLPFLILITAVLGSLYAGIATPTEAGGVGALIAMLLCLQRKKLTVKLVYETALETVQVTAFIMLIVVGAAIFSWVFDFLQLPREMVEYVQGSNLAPWVVMLAIGGVYLALGTIIESISMMLMTLAVTYPIVISLGFDPIWFGVVLVLLIEIGLVTPPVGIILFILRGLSDSVPLKEIVLGVVPFVLIMLSFIVFLYFFPEVVLWLPEKMND